MQKYELIRGKMQLTRGSLAIYSQRKVTVINKPAVNNKPFFFLAGSSYELKTKHVIENTINKREQTDSKPGLKCQVGQPAGTIHRHFILLGGGLKG